MKKASRKIEKNNDRKIDIILREIIRIEKEMEIGFGGMKKDFNKLQDTVDAYAKKS